jgi:la-related protein 1
MPAPTFSYAQAAKGLGPTKTSSNTSSRPESGAVTPAKDITTAQTSSLDSIHNNKTTEQTLPLNPEGLETESLTHPQLVSAADFSAKKPNTESTGSMSPPTMDMIQSSTSTLHREDDLSSIPNASSESTWENVSQTSVAVDKNVDSGDKLHKEGQKAGKDGSWVKVNKPQVEAPAPAVNVWHQRMAQFAKNPITSVRKVPALNGSTIVSQSQMNGRNGFSAENHDRRHDQSKSFRGKEAKREPRPEDEQNKSRRVGPRKPEEAPKVVPPSIQDESSWPTPELAQGDDRKKSVDKGDKSDAAKVSTEKPKWKKVPIQIDSVIFKTPLPNPGSRRGGRPGGRGGRDVTHTRTSPPNARSVRSPTDKNSDETAAIDGTKRETGPEGASPTRLRRSLGEDAAGKRLPNANKENWSRENARRDNKSPSKVPTQEERVSLSSGANNTFQNQPTMQSKSKKPANGADAEKASDYQSQEPIGGDATQSSNGPKFHSHPPQNGGEEGRSQTGDATPNRGAPRNAHTQHNGRRGSIRGRGGYQGFHGHHSPNMAFGGSPGVAFTKSPPMTHDPYWGANQNNHRSYRAPRQNVATDAYGRPSNGFANGGLPPINTYTGRQPFEHQGQTMSAVPYGPVYDQYSLVGAVSMQL